MPKLKQSILTIVIGLALAAGISYAEHGQWHGATANPPLENTPAPINVSKLTQIKEGVLQVNGFRNIGNSIFDGSMSIGGFFRAYETAIFDGKVGIGTINPRAKLDVAGKVRIGDISNFYTLPEQRGTEGQVLKLTDSSGSVDWENEAILERGSLSNVVRASITNGRFTVPVFDAGDNKKILSAYMLWNGSSWPVSDLFFIGSFAYARYDITISSDRLSFAVELKKTDGSTYTTFPFTTYTFYYVVNYF